MKHAGAAALAELAELLAAVRERAALRERKPGIFYRGATAYLHFHEDWAGLFADLKVGTSFERHCVSRRSQQRALLRRIDETLAVVRPRD